MRLLRSLAPLALVVVTATACGSGSSSSPGGGSADTGSSTTLEVRPVFARYAPGVQFGPQAPKDVLTQLKDQSCPMTPRVLQGMLMECGTDKTVYLMKTPVVSGGIASATAKQVGHGKLWFVEVGLDSSTAGTLGTAAKSMVGTELAFTFHGSVLSSSIVDSSFRGDRLAIIGDYDKAQATRLATRLAAS